MSVRVLVFFAVLLSGCGNAFNPQYWIDEPRVIGVTADPPELAPGETSTLRALLADPPATAPADATYTWWRCTKIPGPGEYGDVAPACLDDRTDVDYLVPLGAGETIAVAMPDDDPATLGVPDYTGGVYVPIRVDVSIGGVTQKSIYRLRRHIAERGAPNQNPTFAGLFVGAAPANANADVTPLPSDEPLASVTLDGTLTLRARFTSGSSEPFDVIDGTNGAVRTVNEALKVEWQVEWGDLSSASSGDDTDTDLSFKDAHRRPPNVPIEGVVVHLWAVGRDERGGTAIITGKLRVLPSTVVN